MMPLTYSGPYFLFIASTASAWSMQLDLDARRRREVGDRRGRHAADPEERVDLAVLDRVDRLGRAEALLLDVLLRVEAGAPRARAAP